MSNKRMLVVGGVLLTIVIVCVLILANVYIDESRRIPEEQMALIEESAWPIQEVPILYRPNIEMTKFSSEVQIQEIPKGVTFPEFVDYLYELCDAGFEANEFYGCKHPSMLSSSINPETITELTWMGVSDKYRITATWKKEGTSDRIDNVYVSLYSLDRFNKSGD